MGNLRVLLSKKELEELRAGRGHTLTVWEEGTFLGSEEVMRKSGVMATIVEEPWGAIIPEAPDASPSEGPHD